MRRRDDRLAELPIIAIAPGKDYDHGNETKRCEVSETECVLASETFFGHGGSIRGLTPPARLEKEHSNAAQCCPRQKRRTAENRQAQRATGEGSVHRAAVEVEAGESVKGEDGQ